VFVVSSSSSQYRTKDPLLDLVTSGKNDGMIHVAAAMQAVANSTVATCYNVLKRGVRNACDVM